MMSFHWKPKFRQLSTPSGDLTPTPRLPKAQVESRLPENEAFHEDNHGAGEQLWIKD